MNPASDIQKQISEAADRQLLDWLENGISKWSGQLDESSNPIMIRECLSAAHMQAVLKRLTQLGVTAMPVKGSAAGNLADAAAKRGFVPGVVKFNGQPIPSTPKLPPLSQQDDAATA